MKSKKDIAALVFCVCMFALAAIVQGFTVNNKKMVTEGDPITLFKTFTSARTVSDAQIYKWDNMSSSNVTGNAATATRLQTARTINGVAFDGTANITVADATKEPLITAGTTAQYLRGNKSLSNFAADALAAAPAETATTIKTALGITTLSGSNTGDNAANSLYSGLVSNATHTGDATGSTVLTVSKINGTSLAALSTGLLKNTTATGVPSIAVAGTDYLTPTGSAAALTAFPTLNQSTTGNAATATRLQTARTINGVAFDGTANITVADASKAPLVSPVFTGIPVAPTAAIDTNTTQIATTAFVNAKITVPSVAKTVSTTYLITNSDNVLFCDPSGGNFTVTLPVAAGLPAGKSFSIKNIAAVNSEKVVSIVTADAKTIDLELQIDLIGREGITICYDGVNWVIIA